MNSYHLTLWYRGCEGGKPTLVDEATWRGEDAEDAALEWASCLGIKPTAWRSRQDDKRGITVWAALVQRVGRPL